MKTMRIVQLVSNNDDDILAGLGDDGCIYDRIAVYETPQMVRDRRQGDPTSSPYAMVLTRHWKQQVEVVV
jgi:hypothetical protein